MLTAAEANALIRADPKSARVLHPYIIGDELLHRGAPGRWVIDIDAADATAAKAQAPGAYDRLRRLVLPDRQQRAQEEATGNAWALAADPNARVNWHHRNFLARWWQHSYRREDFLTAIADHDRFIALAATASELRMPVLAFVSTEIRPSHAVQCFAFDDDYSFGILQSAAHAAWFRGRCSHLKSDLRYTSKTVFNTFPWPQAPNTKAVGEIVDAVAAILDVRRARQKGGLSLAQMYDSLREPGRNDLRDAHERLDAAVLRAYGFDKTTDVLVQLLALNKWCAEQERGGNVVRGPGPILLHGTRVTDDFVTA